MAHPHVNRSLDCCHGPDHRVSCSGVPEGQGASCSGRLAYHAGNAGACRLLAFIWHANITLPEAPMQKMDPGLMLSMAGKTVTRGRGSTAVRACKHAPGHNPTPHILPHCTSIQHASMLNRNYKWAW